MGCTHFVGLILIVLARQTFVIFFPLTEKGFPRSRIVSIVVAGAVL